MRSTTFDPLTAVNLLRELARVSRPSAGPEEICDQSLRLIAKALEAKSGLISLKDGPEGVLQPVVRWGTALPSTLTPAVEKAMAQQDLVELEMVNGQPRAVVLSLNAESDSLGVLVLEKPSHWDEPARQFLRSAAQTLACALGAACSLQEANRQGEMLVRRNVELEILRELGGRLQRAASEEEQLQGALDLVLEKLGLDAGWILSGKPGKRNLELAVARGLDSRFVKKAREGGIGHCLCLDVFETGQQRTARNTAECPRLGELGLHEDAMGHASIPLKFERGTLGVMNIANHHGRPFNPQELQFLEVVGNQICLTVDKSRAARAESQRNAEARALSSLAKAIGGSLEQDRVLAAIGDYTRDLLSSDRCAIFLGDDPARLHFAFLSGPALKGLRVGRPADLTALKSRGLTWALTERRAMVVPDATLDPRGNPVLARKWDIGSAIIVPLLAHGRMGGLLVASRSSPSTWNEDEVQLIDALGVHAALMLESSRLYREAQDSLLRLQQAQYGMMQAERLAAVGTLAASLAHEVRNPLNSINLQLVLLSRRVAKVGEPLQSEIVKLIETGRHEISRLDGLVEEFLSLSSIDRISPAKTRPQDLFREIITLMTPMAREGNVRIEEDFPDPLPEIPMDLEKMKQVLINLVRNGIEAMPDGGTLTLASRLEDGLVSLEVTDTGIGIEPGLDIFHFFVTTKRGGTGLGLPIARRIVEAHGGTLTHESEPGSGTTFTMTLKTK